jgi:hypothetical protein
MIELQDISYFGYKTNSAIVHCYNIETTIKSTSAAGIAQPVRSAEKLNYELQYPVFCPLYTGVTFPQA